MTFFKAFTLAALSLSLNVAICARSDFRSITPAPSPMPSDYDVMLEAVIAYNTRADMHEMPKNPLALVSEPDLRDILTTQGAVTAEAAEHFLLCAMHANHYQAAEHLLARLLAAGKSVPAVFQDRLSSELLCYVERIPHSIAAGMSARFVIHLLEQLVKYGAACNYVGRGECGVTNSVLGGFIDAQKRHQQCIKRAGCIPLERSDYLAVITFLIKNGAAFCVEKKFFQAGKMYRLMRNYLHQFLFKYDCHVYQLTLDEIADLIRLGNVRDLQKTLRTDDLMKLLLQDARYLPLMPPLLECGAVRPIAPKTPLAGCTLPPSPRSVAIKSVA
jgi:hypothetical protein